jgi:hypothetical protein
MCTMCVSMRDMTCPPLAYDYSLPIIKQIQPIVFVSKGIMTVMEPIANTLGPTSIQCSSLVYYNPMQATT